MWKQGECQWMAVLADVSIRINGKPHDPHVNPMGAKGIGEIGIVGRAAAVANAVFDAAGMRVRGLPITPDKLVSSTG